MDDEARKHLISNIVGHMGGISGPKKNEIIMRQLCHFFRANEELGKGVADGLGVDLSSMKMEEMEAEH
jgi:catalase